MGRSEVYDQIGMGYALGRRSDPRWAMAIENAVGNVASVVNVGAGTGSYEPKGPVVIAVEPSQVMLLQRPAGSALAVRGYAEHLPFADQAVDTAMAVLTVHHWSAWRAGLGEMRRVASMQVVVAYDTRLHCDFWMVREYIPEVADLELGRPSAEDIADVLQATTVIPLLVPWDFTDGVFPAHWRRPAAYLDERVRSSCSALAQTDPRAVTRGVNRLRDDLESGRWHERHQELLDLDEFDAGFRLIIAGR